MVRTAVSLGAAGAAAVFLAGSLSRLFGVRATLVKDRPAFPQPDAGLVLAHEGRSGGRATTTYVTRGDLKAEQEALGAALLGALAFAGALLAAPRYHRRAD
jgi:hypothetical protein